MTHPKAVEATELASKEAARRAKLAAREKEIVTKNKLRFIHVRAEDALGIPQPNGGCTVAYQFQPGDHVCVSVAICHRKDFYSKSVGRLQAAEYFEAGRTITLRIPRSVTPSHFLKSAFYLTAQTI